MLLQIRTLDAAARRQLMDVYSESNLENTDYFYPELTDKEAAVRLVERDYLNYLETEFLAADGNLLLVWEKQGIWTSALRLHCVRSRLYYIEALETRPDCRCRGCGSALLRGTVELLKKSGPFRLCDNVDKQSEASLATHKACGFAVVSDNGYDYLRKETDGGSYGMEFAYNPACG